MHCRIVSQWFFDEAAESYGAEIEQNYSGLGLADLVNPTNVPNEPNIFVGESKAGGGLVNQIANDSRYTENCILTTHDSEAQVPTQEKFDAIASYLQNKGMTSAQITEAIGTSPGTRTHWDISQDLIGWLKSQ